MGDARNTRTRVPLTRERVVTAAMDLVDQEGLDRLTMRNLGRALHVDPMAAYHWFPNKRAILQAIYAEILQEVDVPLGADSGWPDALKAIARSFHRTLLAHPNALPMISTEPVMTQLGLGFVERAASVLVRNGLSPAQALAMINGVAALVIGNALAEAGVTPGTEPIEPGEMAALFTSLSSADFPTVTGAVAEGGEGAFVPPSRLEQLLDALVLGFELQLQRH